MDDNYFYFHSFLFVMINYSSSQKKFLYIQHIVSLVIFPLILFFQLDEFLSAHINMNYIYTIAQMLSNTRMHWSILLLFLVVMQQPLFPLQQTSSGMPCMNKLQIPAS